MFQNSEFYLTSRSRLAKKKILSYQMHISANPFLLLCHSAVISLRQSAELKPTQPEKEVRLLPSAGAWGKVAPQIQGTLYITYIAPNQFGQKPQPRLKPT